VLTDGSEKMTVRRAKGEDEDGVVGVGWKKNKRTLGEEGTLYMFCPRFWPTIRLHDCLVFLWTERYVFVRKRFWGAIRVQRALFF
jgi:hypothetical protein